MAEDNSSDYDVKELLEAAKFIFKKAQDVHIDQEGIKRMASHVRFLNFILRFYFEKSVVIEKDKLKIYIFNKF